MKRHGFQSLVKGLFVFLLGSGQVFGSVIVSSVTNPATGHDYYLIRGMVTQANPLGGISWSEAREFAATLAEGNEVAYLVSISSPEEKNWILSHFADPGFDHSSPFNLFWTGLSDQESEGAFRWENGDPFVYENRTGEGPVDLTGEEDFVFMVNTTIIEPPAIRGEWNDYSDKRVFQETIPFSAVIEVAPVPVPVPEPTASLLILASCLGIRCRRRSGKGMANLRT